jgi:hypothetical protein
MTVLHVAHLFVSVSILTLLLLLLDEKWYKLQLIAEKWSDWEKGYKKMGWSPRKWQRLKLLFG